MTVVTVNEIKATQLNRQTLYRTLSNDCNPTPSTLLCIVRALGPNSSFRPATAA